MNNVYRPYYCANGNKVVEQWKEDFTDRVGNCATLHKVKYTTPKGKINEAVARVVWK